MTNNPAKVKLPVEQLARQAAGEILRRDNDVTSDQFSQEHFDLIEKDILVAIEAALAQRDEQDIMSVLRIRCTKHLNVPQQNSNEHSGGECGGCIAEERDTATNSHTVLLEAASNMVRDGACYYLGRKNNCQCSYCQLRSALEQAKGKGKAKV